MTLSEFLAARLDEDEAGALETAPASERLRWGVDTGDAPVRYCVVTMDNLGDYTGGGVAEAWAVDPGTGKYVAAHIARHDPARALREVEAKRHRLERYLEEYGFDLPDGVIDGRDPWEATRDQDVKDALETEVREDAAVYDSHPDYDEAWRP